MDSTDSRENGDVSNKCKKKIRRRKRHFYNEIREQMEFYFGDSNLTKDRFLKKLIDKDAYVPLKTFLTFNKIKSLTSSIADIAMALSSSDLLEFDDTGTKIRRKTSLPENRYVDDKTLYVESLPITADHEWLKSIFEQFGKVAYVSLPRFRKSKKIKEFGFVEFEDTKSIAKAIKAFEEFNGVLKMDETDPNNLKSITTYNIERDDLKTDSVPNERKRKSSNSIENYDIPNKKSKVSLVCDQEDKFLNENSSSISESEGQPNFQQGSDNVQGNLKKRRKKGSKIKTDKQNKQKDFATDPAYLELKILPKIHWKRLRNKYLNFQREKAAELKKQIKVSQKKIDRKLSNKSGISASISDENIPSKNITQSGRKLTGMHMNFYGAGDDECNAKTQKDCKVDIACEGISTFSYEPGLIVVVTFLEPCANVKEFKADMRQYSSVKYVDVKEGANKAYIRLESSQAAKDFVCQVHSVEYKCHILSGDSETDYWKKIESDRAMKLNKQIKLPQKRGREKVKKILTSHIRFNEDE